MPSKQTFYVALAEAFMARLKLRVGDFRGAQRLAERALARVHDSSDKLNIRSLKDNVLRTVRATRH